jgi:GGDEF domain-containing protein
LLATRRKRSPFAVLFIDLDHFKAINDQHGHATGDVVLQCVGHLIAQSVRQSDLAGRIGGEEFAVLLPDTEAQGLRLSISASIGVALGGMAEQNMQDVQHQADLAMYEAKAAGRNRVTLFKPPQAVPNPLAAG